MFDELNARNYRISGKALVIAAAVAGSVMVLASIGGAAVVYAGAGAAALFIISRLAKA